MERFLQKSVLAAAFTIGGLSFLAGHGQASNQPELTGAEKKSIEELTRRGVPLQADPQGRIRWIEAPHGELSDKALRFLPGLQHLEWLEIGGGAVTAAGLAHLAECRSLKRLYIHDLDLRGEKLPWLSRLVNLEALSLQRTGIDGRVLRNITAADSLLVLNLTGNRIVDEDMQQIAGFRNLEVLALANTRISGAGLARLKGMEKLNELNLINCRIVDGDLDYLVTMPNLRIVYTRGCDLSDMAVIQLRSKSHKLAVFR